MKSSIRIASGQGFWGDLPDGPIDQVKRGSIDYLVMDYLAEVTMSIMQKQKMRNPSQGYARDILYVLDNTLEEISEQGIKVVTNAGGVNPHACKDAILDLARSKGIEDIKVAVIDGDDILDRMDELVEDGHLLHNMESGAPITDVKDDLLSANVYLGCRPVVKALENGADIVITGRVTDTGLTLGPMAYEFGWDFDDYDKMAAGTIAGHIIECGAQVSGGNFTDWYAVDDFTEIGFPIIEATPNGDFYVTKHENTGGLINEMTVKEQLLYEIGDPHEYITPDCIADFTSIQLEEVEENKVKIYGIQGRPETDTYKISASYIDGYKLSSTLVYSWPYALRKAKKGGEILQQRAQRLGLEIDQFRVEYVGYNGCDEQPLDEDDLNNDYSEIEMRISAMSHNKDDLNRFGKEVAPLILTGPSGVTGFAGGRPKASEIVAYWPALLDKQACEPNVEIHQP
ncbi:MAG: acyclic terpene utilization AtuA family protein [Bacteroidota bacterium]